MLALLLSLALAAPAPAVEVKRRVLVLDFKAEGVDQAVAHTLTEIVANAFARNEGLLVTSGADLRAALDVEASRQALACDDESCLAEVAGALGAELVVSGSVGKLGDLLVVTLSLYDAVAQASTAKQKVEDTNLAALSPRLDAAVDHMLGARPSLVPALISSSIGTVVAVAGAVVAVTAFGVQEDPASTGAQKDSALVAYPIGLACVSVGVGLVVGGVVFGLLALE